MFFRHISLKLQRCVELVWACVCGAERGGGGGGAGCLGFSLYRNAHNVSLWFLFLLVPVESYDLRWLPFLYISVIIVKWMKYFQHVLNSSTGSFFDIVFFFEKLCTCKYDYSYSFLFFSLKTRDEQLMLSIFWIKVVHFVTAKTFAYPAEVCIITFRSTLGWFFGPSVP